MVVFNLVNTTLEIYKWIVILSSILSFINLEYSNPIAVLLRNLTEPVYKRIRMLVPTVYGNIDFAALIVLILIYIFQLKILPLLFSI